MESTLNALGGILLRALPTFFLVLLLHLYLKRVFFAPLNQILKQRYDATEGARQAAVDGADRIGGQPRAATARVRSGCPVGHAGGSGAPHVDRRSPPGRARHTRLKLCTTLWTAASPRACSS